MNSITDFIGKEVKLFPNDTYKKSAILLEISDYGYLFKMTKCELRCGYKVDDIVFLNHSTKVEMLIN
jgi:hypothetical protein